MRIKVPDYSGASNKDDSPLKMMYKRKKVIRYKIETSGRIFLKFINKVRGMKPSFDPQLTLIDPDWPQLAENDLVWSQFAFICLTWSYLGQIALDWP